MNKKEAKNQGNIIKEIFSEERYLQMHDDFIEMNRILTDLGYWSNLYTHDEIGYGFIPNNISLILQALQKLECNSERIV